MARFIFITGGVVSSLGKGLAAASQVATLQNMLRYALCAADSLSEAISQMNFVLTEQNLLAGFADHAPDEGFRPVSRQFAVQ